MARRQPVRPRSTLPPSYISVRPDQRGSRSGDHSDDGKLPCSVVCGVDRLNAVDRWSGAAILLAVDSATRPPSCRKPGSSLYDGCGNEGRFSPGRRSYVEKVDGNKARTPINDRDPRFCRAARHHMERCAHVSRASSQWPQFGHWHQRRGRSSRQRHCCCSGTFLRRGLRCAASRLIRG